MNDPEIANAFRALYKRDAGSGKTFTLLYGPQNEQEIPEEEGQDVSDPESPVEIVDPGPDLEAIKKDAYDEGFRLGQEAGYQAGLEQATAGVERLSAILSDVETMWGNIVTAYESKIIQLIGRMVEKVVYGRVAVDNEIITRAILHAFEQISDPVKAVITVNPEDYEFIEVVKEDFFEKIKGLKQVTLVSDPLISVGGCRIETPSGEVHTNIEERLEAVKRSVMSVSP
jgi:flagellar assembly protein FliH